MSQSVSEVNWSPRRGAIIGVGLLGTSVALGLRQLWPNLHLVGMARRESTRRAALDVKAVHEVTDNLRTACQNADLVIIGTPVDCVATHVIEAAGVCGTDALITDVGSTKAAIVADIERSPQAVKYYVGSHPLAGSEKAGPWHGRAELLRGRLVVLTPTQQTPQRLLQRCESMWRALGAKTQCMSPADHDAALAATSHVPHLVAAALASLADPGILNLAGTGWKDTTRIASGDPGLWRAILEANCEHVRSELDRLIDHLDQYRKALALKKSDDLYKLLQRGKDIRDRVA